MIARTELQQSAVESAFTMDKTPVDTRIAVDYDATPTLGDLIEDKLVNAVPSSLPNHCLWQMPSRRGISRRLSSDDTTCQSDISSTTSTSSKYNSDSDVIHSTGATSPATSWSSQCDETFGRETFGRETSARGTAGTKQQAEAPQASGEGSFPPSAKPALRVQTDLPWDPWFPDWDQCLSPEPMRKPPAWIASQCSRGLWEPPARKGANEGPRLWGR